MGNQANIGIFAIGLDAYWAQFEGLEQTVLENYGQIMKKVDGACRAVSAGLVDNYEKARSANQLFHREQVDLIFCYCATYSPSSNVLLTLQGLDVPVIVLNLQPMESMAYSKWTKIGDWLGTLSCAGAPEVTAVLLKKKMKYSVITGMVAGDYQADGEIEQWCRAAQVLHHLKNARIGLFGHAFPGMMDLYVDETKAHNDLGVYTEFMELHQIKNAAETVSAKEIEEIKKQLLTSYELTISEDTKEFQDLCRYGAALVKLVKDCDLDALAMHYAGETEGEYKDLVSPMNIIFSLLIAQGIPCCVEGDIKTVTAMMIMKLLTGCCATAELYSMDFKDDICLIGHSGSSDVGLSEEKPVLKESEVFHGKSGKGYLTQFFVKPGPVTLMALSEDGQGNYRLIAAQGESESGEILMLGDTNTRVRFPMSVREFAKKWCMAGPSHHACLTTGHHVETVKKVALGLGMELVVIS